MKAVKTSLLLLALAATASGGALHLKRREIGTADRASLSLEAPGPRWSAGRSHLMLQFRHAVNEQIIAELNQRGAYVVGAVPDFGVMVSAPDGFSVEDLDIEWAGRLSLDDKISPLLENFRRPIETWVIAEFFADVDMQEARRLAEAAGFRIHEHPDLIPTHLLLSGAPGRLAGLAQWDEVAYIFPASRPLIRREHVEHCVGALTSGGSTPMYVTGSSGWAKDASGQVTLSYVFGARSTKLDAAQANQELLRALNAWTQYAPIKFVAGQSAGAARTIYIQFLSKDHGDGFPFDGPGGVLAHTFYPAPPNPESVAGDMHLDADENWHIGTNTDLYTVAVHEAGHALGLAHSDNPAAVMYPYYRLGANIATDDIAGIQSLYGAPGGTSTPATPVAPTPSLALTISTPAKNSSTTAATIAVAGTTSSGQGTVRVTWQTDHGSSGSATGTTQWSAPSVPLVVGSNTITVTASDSSRKAVQTVTVTRTTPPVVDHTPPSITLSSPAGTVVTTRAGSIDLKGTASDNVSVTKVTWQSNTASGTATGTTSWTASAVPLLLGDNVIIVRAYDAAGNSAWRSLLVIRN
jgi:hypothetical protein